MSPIFRASDPAGAGRPGDLAMRSAVRLDGELVEGSAAPHAGAVGRDLGLLHPRAVRVSEEVAAGGDGAVHPVEVDSARGRGRRGGRRRDAGGRSAGERSKQRGDDEDRGAAEKLHRGTIGTLTFSRKEPGRGGAPDDNPARMTACLVLLRHGQASFGAIDYDILSDVGRRQAVRLGEALKGRIPRVDALVSGTLRRQRDTASVCLEAMGLAAPLDEDPAWNEFDHEDVIRAYDPRFPDHALFHRDLAAHAAPGEKLRPDLPRRRRPLDRWRTRRGLPRVVAGLPRPRGRRARASRPRARRDGPRLHLRGAHLGSLPRPLADHGSGRGARARLPNRERERHRARGGREGARPPVVQRPRALLGPAHGLLTLR